MAVYPVRGERYENVNGWTVYILGVKFNETIRLVNPEFYCEVRFIYENSGKYTEMPITWFLDVYRKREDSVRHLPVNKSTDWSAANMHDYSWLDDD